MTKAQILIVEDDRSLAEVLEYNLRQDGYQTAVANDGQDGLRQARLQVAGSGACSISCCRWSTGWRFAGGCGPTR